MRGNPTLRLHRLGSSNVQPPAKPPGPLFHSRTKQKFSPTSNTSSSHRLPFPTIIKDNAYKYASSLPINQLLPHQGTTSQAASTLQWNLNPNHDLFLWPLPDGDPLRPHLKGLKYVKEILDESISLPKINQPRKSNPHHPPQEDQQTLPSLITLPP